MPESEKEKNKKRLIHIIKVSFDFMADYFMKFIFRYDYTSAV